MILVHLTIAIFSFTLIYVACEWKCDKNIQTLDMIWYLGVVAEAGRESSEDDEY